VNQNVNPNGPPSEFPEVWGPWQPRPRRGAARQITPVELQAWIVYQDDRLLVLDKPGDVVCHPSKEGPWSSLVGAAKEGFGLPAAHLVFRLDRETSGLVVLAKDPATARKLQIAAERRRYGKTYLALLVGELAEEVRVDQSLGPDYTSPVAVKSRVVPVGEGQAATTVFAPLAHARGHTLARVKTESGRKHQIRAHAQWLGYPLVGDKIYGPDPRLFLEFVEHGWTPALAERLILPRQALHCAEIDLTPAGEPHVFKSPLPVDLRLFCAERMGLMPEVFNH
jgi:23S rRNA pseudouridine1911/1915/1917 synthase